MAVVRLLVAWALAVALATVETRYLPGPLRGRLLFDPFLWIAVYYGLRRGPAVGTLVGCLTGLLQDAACGTFLGWHGLAKTVAGSFGSWLGGRLTLTATIPQFLILMIATALNSAVLLGLGLLLGRGLVPVSPWFLPVQCVANAIAGAAIFQFVGERQRHGVLRRA